MRLGILFTIILMQFGQFLFGQEKQSIDILNADKLTITTGDDRQIRKLSGNVRLKNGETVVSCDSAILDVGSNDIDAYGNVHINSNDSLNIYSDSLKYIGKDRLAILNHNVRLTDGAANIRTRQLFYNLNTEVAYYYQSAVITTAGNELTSRKGQYFTTSKDAFFRDSVVLINPNYLLEADTLQFNTETEVATFHGPTEINSDQNRIDCSSGWYDTANDLAAFGLNTTLQNPSQLLNADSIYYDRKSGLGKTYYRFYWVDKKQSVSVRGTRSNYNEIDEYLFAIERPELISYESEDSLHMCGDTLEGGRLTDTLGQTYRYFTAYRDVRIYQSDLQGVCDSLFHSYLDTTLRLFYDPVLWSDQSQMNADTISVAFRNNAVDRIYLNRNAFTITEIIPQVYDQLKGNNMIGFLVDSKLREMKVNGSAESIYFGRNDNGEFIGMNHAKSSRMRVFFENNKASEVRFITEPEAIFYPIQQIKEPEMRLSGFSWFVQLRPQSRNDIF